MTAYVWYFTPVTRVGGSDNWTIGNGVTSEPLNVWFGTTAPPAEDVALYDLIIVDNNSANGKVGSKELSDALSSAGFPGLTPANFGSIALTSIPGQSEKIHTVGFTTDQSIKSGEVGYVISLQPLPSGQINAPWQPGLGNFIEFWPGKLSDICFARGTMIDTPEGAKPIEALRVGDFICTKDHGPQPIRWIGASRRSAKALRQNPQVMPILIAKDTFGPDRPNRDLRVSRSIGSS